MSKTIFINYRREDSSPIARGLREDLIEAFGEVVFMDIDEIRVGDTWPQTLNDALKSATVLLVVIGPDWLRIADGYGRRRLDQSDDWVRIEIEYSLARKIPIVPILVSGATMPERAGLPDAIDALVNQQCISLREAQWKQDLQPLIDRLAASPLGFVRSGDKVPVPEWPPELRPDHLPRALAEEELRGQLAEVPKWKIVRGPLPGEYPRTRVELTRRFRFLDFEQAIQFMQAAMPHISLVNHHPRWENVFKTVTVWLTTWDAGHNVTKLDFELARYLDGLYERSKSTTI